MSTKKTSATSKGKTKNDKKDNNPKNTENAEKRGGRRFLIIVTVVLGILAICAVGAYSYMHGFLGKINRIDPAEVVPIAPESEDFETDEDTAEGDQVIHPDDVAWHEADVKADDEKLINILLVGQDRRQGEGRQRSDSMVLCSINTGSGEISLISFLRDLYVQIPGGYSDNRLNVTYVFGGFPLLDETLNHNFGITVDGNVEVDFGRFVEIIDTLGGIDIEMSAAEAWAILGAGQGTHHLNGTQALEYSRLRRIDSDFERTGRQRKVISAALGKVRQMSLKELLSFLDVILPSLTTDMTDSEIISIAKSVYPLFSKAKVNSYRIPADGAYYGAYINGMSVLVPDIPENCRLLAEDYLPLDD